MEEEICEMLSKKLEKEFRGIYRVENHSHYIWVKDREGKRKIVVHGYGTDIHPFEFIYIGLKPTETTTGTPQKKQFHSKSEMKHYIDNDMIKEMILLSL